MVRFLHLLFDEETLKPSKNTDFLIKILPNIKFNNIEVTPNENISNEISVTDVGRFDIFLSTEYSCLNEEHKRLNIIFELKIDSKPEPKQSKKYADWLLSNHAKDINLLIYILPTLKADSFETVGDDRWHCLSYQLLNDKVLTLLLEHPNINEKTRPFIIQYIKNLKIRYRGIKMAITEEEKRIALALYEKYSDVFDSIYDALASMGTIDYSTSELSQGKGRTTGRIAVRIDGKIFSDTMVRTLFEKILKFLVDSDYIKKAPLPWGVSEKRYIITNEKEPLHPNGRPFFYPVQYDDYTMESHYSRDRALQIIAVLCKKLELDYEIIDA